MTGTRDEERETGKPHVYYRLFSHWEGVWGRGMKKGSLFLQLMTDRQGLGKAVVSSEG